MGRDACTVRRAAWLPSAVPTRSTGCCRLRGRPCRLALTLEQIEALSRARAQREGGQRLGRADPTPWQYHPEMASTAPVTQITLRLAASEEERAASSHAPASPAAAKGGGRGMRGGAAGQAAAAQGAQGAQVALPLYLTAGLLADGREVFVVHGASADEEALLAALMEVRWAGLPQTTTSASGCERHASVSASPCQPARACAVERPVHAGRHPILSARSLRR